MTSVLFISPLCTHVPARNFSVIVYLYIRSSIMSYIPDFTVSEEEEEEVYEPPQKRRRGPNRVWKKTATFQCSREAQKAVEDRLIWKNCGTNDCADGKKVEYRCTAATYRNNECPARLHLLYHSDSQAVSLFETKSEHYNHVSDPTRGLSIQMKSFVKEKFEEGIRKPKGLLNLIRGKGMVEPSTTKLKSYLQQLRYEKFGAPTVSASEVKAWCEERKEIPADDDTAFVLQYYVEAQSRNVDEQYLRIILTTKRLLSLMRTSEMVQIDATYKLTWQGYPVMVVGTSDRNQVFHPFALAVCSAETAEDYAFIFDALHKYDLEGRPTILLADTSEAITLGYQKVFGVPRIRLMCFFHVLHNLEKYLKVLKARDCVLIKNDIHELQTCASESSFKVASGLFFKKWDAHTTVVISTVIITKFIIIYLGIFFL